MFMKVLEYFLIKQKTFYFKSINCSGSCITVDDNSYANITIHAMNFVAIFVDAPCNIQIDTSTTSVGADPPRGIIVHTKSYVLF